jgi:anti-sigma-K factor RskA
MESHNLDDAATYALNALPFDEARAFERRLDPALADELASYRRVSLALTNGLPDIVPAASPELWDRISEKAGISESAVPDHSSRFRHFRPSFMMLAAAALIAVVAVGATSLLAIRDVSTGPRSLAAAAATSTDALAVNLTSPDGVTDIQAEVVIAADGTGYVIADSLPRLNDDRTYQLWLIVDDRVISAALLGPDPDVVEFRAEGNVAGIAISNEIAGGVVVSEVAPTALWLADSL